MKSKSFFFVLLSLLLSGSSFAQNRDIQKVFSIECVRDYNSGPYGSSKLQFSSHEADWNGRSGRLVSQYAGLVFSEQECQEQRWKLQKFTNQGRPFMGDKSMRLCWPGSGGYRIIAIDVYFNGAINKVSEKVVGAKYECERIADQFNRNSGCYQ